MRLARKSIRFAIRLITLLISFFLLLAILWTLQQTLLSYGRQRSASATVDARRVTYRATATALAEAPSELDAGSVIVLLQDALATSTPRPDLARPDASAAATPAAIDLPDLHMPADPAPGLSLGGTVVPGRAPAIPRDYELVNIILLGGDSDMTADDFVRTDTMIIVSLNTETGAVSMVNLPRDLYVYIPRGVMGRLNIAYGIGENVNWQPDGGFGLLRQTIFYNFGINVHYYALVNFGAFETIIDRLGGVDIAVDCTYQDLYPVDNWVEGAPASRNYRWRTLEVGYYTFDGFDALWYARTRKYTDDLDRGRRQQLLLRAMWRKARSNGLITTIPALWGELTSLVETNLPFDVMLSLLPYLLDLDLDSVQNLTFKRNYHTKPWRAPSNQSVLLPQPEPVADLMRDFYTPPSANQLALAGPSIAVYNASGQAHWDIVAAERLRWDGYNAIAMGEATPRDTSLLRDHVAASKGSLIPRLIKALNLTPKQVETMADPERDADYEVFLGPDYDSCTYGVLPVKRR